MQWIEWLEKDPRRIDGSFDIDLGLQLKLFETASSWLVRSQKLKPQSDDLPQGIEEMRRLIYGEVERVIEAKGVVTLPPKKPGRPTKAEAVIRARYKEAQEIITPDDPGDDSELARMLKVAGK